MSAAGELWLFSTVDFHVLSGYRWLRAASCELVPTHTHKTPTRRSPQHFEVQCMLCFACTRCTHVAGGGWRSPSGVHVLVCACARETAALPMPLHRLVQRLLSSTIETWGRPNVLQQGGNVCVAVHCFALERLVRRGFYKSGMALGRCTLCATPHADRAVTPLVAVQWLRRNRRAVVSSLARPVQRRQQAPQVSAVRRHGLRPRNQLLRLAAGAVCIRHRLPDSDRRSCGLSSHARPSALAAAAAVGCATFWAAAAFAKANGAP
jgi:hypothetical protein